jgi:hypothetical protein
MSFNILNQPVLLPSSTLPHELDLRLKMPSTATVSHFATLPVEICLNIFRLFCHHTMQYDYHGDDEAKKELASNISSLCSLSRTCRGLRALAQPILHHHFPTQSPSCEAQALYRFVRTITQRPDLADAVRVIELDQEYWSWRRGVDDTGHPGSSNELDEFADFHGDVAETQDPARIEQAARQFGLLPRDDWHFVTHLSTRCYTPNADPWTDKHRWLMLGTEACELFGRLALCLCANTRLVDFGRFIQHYDPWAANPSLPSWPNVECVRVRGESWPGRVNRRPGVGPAGDMANLAGLTDRLPNLNTLQLQFRAFRGDGREGLGAAGGNPSPAEALRGLDLSCLLRLDLTFCTLSRDRLAQLLEMCASLTEFSFLALSDVELHQVAARHPANPREVADLLQNHCPRLHRTLRRLRLEHFDNLDWWPSAVHGPMTNLNALRTVHLGANGLFTYPWADTRVLPGILPPNIELSRRESGVRR